MTRVLLGSPRRGSNVFGFRGRCLESHSILFRYVNCSSRLRIPPNATFAHLSTKRAKASQLHPVTAVSQGRHDFIQDSVNDLVYIALKQMRGSRCDTNHQLRFDHDSPQNEL